jgi:hypothetical protein
MNHNYAKNKTKKAKIWTQTQNNQESHHILTNLNMSLIEHKNENPIYFNKQELTNENQHTA